VSVSVCPMTHACMCDMTYSRVCDMTHSHVCEKSHVELERGGRGLNRKLRHVH